jgi:hypothetical protein
MNRHPAVWIFRGPFVAEEAYQPILWGLEEEGIPFEVRDTSEGVVRDLARQAANGSPLDVGIAMGAGGEVVLHHRDLPTEAPLLSIKVEPLKPAPLRRLGMNAARLVKRQPLALGYEAPAAADSQQALRNLPNGLEDLIIGILEELLNDPNFHTADRS